MNTDLLSSLTQIKDARTLRPRPGTRPDGIRTDGPSVLEKRVYSRISKDRAVSRTSG